MKNIFSRWFANRKSRIERRLDKSKGAIAGPGFSPSAGQVANVLVAFAMDTLGPDAVKAQLAALPAHSVDATRPRG